MSLIVAFFTAQHQRPLPGAIGAHLGDDRILSRPEPAHVKGAELGVRVAHELARDERPTCRCNRTSRAPAVLAVCDPHPLTGAAELCCEYLMIRARNTVSARTSARQSDGAELDRKEATHARTVLKAQLARYTDGSVFSHRDAVPAVSTGAAGADCPLPLARVAHPRHESVVQSRRDERRAAECKGAEVLAGDDGAT